MRYTKLDGKGPKPIEVKMVRIAVHVLNGATGEVTEIVANVPAASEQDAVAILFARARRDDYYYRFLGMRGVLHPVNGTPVERHNQTYWALEA